MHTGVCRCERFFLEVLRVPRMAAKLDVFALKLKITSQCRDLRASLNLVRADPHPLTSQPTGPETNARAALLPSRGCSVRCAGLVSAG